MTDLTARDLIQRLADAREAEQAFGPMPDARDSLLEEARAYLATPDEPAVPTDAELLELMPETMRDEFAACANTYSTATGGVVKPGIFRTVLNTVALEYARAVLASDLEGKR